MSIVTQSARRTLTTRSSRPLAFGSSGATRTTASRTTSPSLVTIFGLRGFVGFSNALISALRSGVIVSGPSGLLPRTPRQFDRSTQFPVGIEVAVQLPLQAEAQVQGGAWGLSSWNARCLCGHQPRYLSRLHRQ